MGNKESPNRWFNSWRSQPQPPEADPADMGTAFGLDLSLNVLHPERPVEPTARPASWVSRLALRRKPV